MADIKRVDDYEIVKQDPTLRRQQLEVYLSEKLNQLKALDLHLDKIKTVEVKKIELQKATLAKQIEQLRQEIISK